MSSRHTKEIDRIKGDLASREKVYLRGYLDGMKEMYNFQGWDSVNEWFGEEPAARRLTLVAIAIEEMLS